VAPLAAAPSTVGGTGAGTKAPSSIYEALGGGNLGGGPVLPTTVTMVYDPTVNPMSVAPGVQMVYDPTAPQSVPAGIASSVPLYGSRMNTVLANIAVQPLNNLALSNIYNMTRATIPNAFMG
jgi:hypothetical protein